MIPTDAEIVAKIAALYAAPEHDTASADENFVFIGARKQEGGTRSAIVDLGSSAALWVFEGSVTREDWERNLLAEIPCPVVGHPEWGDLAFGFYRGMYQAVIDVWPYLSMYQPIYVGGHSRGAAEALLAAAWLGRERLGRAVLCGLPRVGCAALRAHLFGWPINAYRNKGDPVVNVPTDPPFTDAAPWIDLDVPPAPDDSWGLLAAHHIELYAKGISAAA